MSQIQLTPQVFESRFKTMHAARIFIFALLITTGFSHAAEAAKKKKSAPPPSEDMTLPVPQSEMSLPALVPVEKNPLRVEFAFSSWEPSKIQESSYLPGASGLGGTGLPKVSFNVLASPWKGRVKVSPIYGLAFSQLQRQANLVFAEEPSTVTQTVNFFSVRAGLEVEPLQPYLGLLRPFGTLALLPTFETAEMSPLSNGINRVFFAGELTGGLAVEVPALESALGLKDFDFEAGIDATTGISSAFSGFGFMAGTKITI